MIIKEYRCSEGHISTLRESISQNTKEIPCTKCGLQAERIISLSNVQIPGGTPTHHKAGKGQGYPKGPIEVGDLD